MATYAFFTPIKPGKTDTWKQYVNEMTGARKAELAASRKRVGLTREDVWLQQTPMGDFAVVYWEAADIGNVFHGLMTSQDPFDAWFREKVFGEIHGIDPTGPMPPMNQQMLGA